jgi:hypothetical protein
MALLILTLIFLILNTIILRIFAMQEMFESYWMLLGFIVASFIPVINILAFIFFGIVLITTKYDNVDDFAKTIFFVKSKNTKADDNFKGKGYR